MPSLSRRQTKRNITVDVETLKKRVGLVRRGIMKVLKIMKVLDKFITCDGRRPLLWHPFNLFFFNWTLEANFDTEKIDYGVEVVNTEVDGGPTLEIYYSSRSKSKIECWNQYFCKACLLSSDNWNHDCIPIQIFDRCSDSRDFIVNQVIFDFMRFNSSNSSHHLYFFSS